MTFNSLFFFPFAAAFFVFWPRARVRVEWSWGYLVAFSFFFYATFSVEYLPLLIATGLVDFAAGLAMQRFPQRKRALLIVSLASNLGVLGVFKYAGFAGTTLNAAFQLAGVPLHAPVWAPALPVGISFYTFQSMSYVIDVYRGRVEPTGSLLHFFAYLSIWPHLVAGPIQRGAHLLPQLAREPAPVTEECRFEGLRRVVRGYFKKVVIADNLAPAVNAAFALSPDSGGALFWWTAAAMFGFQIYGDFAGYSDIGRGLALWMGYDLGPNFEHPYGARSMREFWSRWHISLSTWFRDYVFASLPLRGGGWEVYSVHRNMWITMLFSGLWHGASWTFVAWGALHAAFISVEQLTGWPKRLCRTSVGRLVAWVFTLSQVWVAWVVFRAPTIAHAAGILRALFVPTCGDWPETFSTAAWFALAVAAGREIGLAWGPELPRVFARAEPALLAAAITASIFLRGPGADFIYVQF